jgi:hypothetical protein
MIRRSNANSPTARNDFIARDLQPAVVYLNIWVKEYSQAW